jgi:uroporphyrinogen-III synthase
MSEQLQSLLGATIQVRNEQLSSLFGKRVVVTRAAHQAADLVELLQSRGARPILYPCINIQPPEDTTDLDAALLAGTGGYFDWLVITSANTALIVQHRMKSLDFSLEEMPVAAVGPKTAEAVREWLGLEARVVAEEYTAAGLALALGDLAGQHVLLPQSAIARPILATALRDAGASVMVVEAYRTEVGRGGDDVASMLAAGEIEAITFTSPSTAQNFVQRLVEENGQPSLLDTICLAAIGPVTAQAMRKLGFQVNVMPERFTLLDLVKALEAYFAREEL